MKKYLFMALACGLALTSCEDVPAPYEIFTEGEIQGGGSTGSSGKSLPYTSASLNAEWDVVTVTGTPWSLGNTYAKATGYDNASRTTTPTESWLISPSIDLTTDAGAAHIAVDHVIRYVDKSSAPISNHTMWITSEFAGDVTTTNWIQLDYHPVESANQSWDFYAADEVAIPAAFIGKTVYVAFKFVCGASSTTWELKNFNVLSGQAAAGTNPNPDSDPSVPIGDVKGNGTADDPYNVAGILTYTKGLGADINSDKEVYFKGVVSNVKEISTKDNYNNATFYISDDGKAVNEFYVYRCLGLNKADILNATLVEAGDEVVICGKVVNFKGNTPETVQKEAYIVSIKKSNGEVVSPDESETPDPTPDTPDDSGDCLTFDISANCFNIPSDRQTEVGTYTSNGVSITITPSEGFNYYYNSKDHYVILGKEGATVEFNGFDFDVAKIEVTGRSGASANTLQNVYVGNDAVSTQTKGAQGTNTYVIKDGYRAAGTHYVLRVESAHNTQFTEIKVYKAQ